MFVYRQSTFDTTLKCKEGDLTYDLKSENGERIENGRLTKISTSDCFISPDEASLKISDDDLKKLVFFLRNVNKIFSSPEMKFYCYLYLHNEKVLINDLQDCRNYGFLKLVFERKSNLLIEEIPVCDDNFEILENKVIKVIDENKEFLNFSVSKSSRKAYESVPVVFSSQAAGYLVHEILGHMLEDDIYRYYGEKYKNISFSSNLTVRDDPTFAGQITGLDKYDDLGTLISPVTLVENGKIVNNMSMESLKSENNLPYGFARRESYKHDVSSRMRCTYIEKSSDMNEKSIIKEYGDCIFIKRAYSGVISPQNGDFELKCVGFFVDSGEFKNLIGDLRLSGNLLKNFNSIDIIGNDLEFFGGYCVKLGQSVRVAVGSPTISMRDIIVEGDVYE